jgi:hypothetical protein
VPFDECARSGCVIAVLYNHVVREMLLQLNPYLLLSPFGITSSSVPAFLPHLRHAQVLPGSQIHNRTGIAIALLTGICRAPSVKVQQKKVARERGVSGTGREIDSLRASTLPHMRKHDGRVTPPKLPPVGCSVCETIRAKRAIHESAVKTKGIARHRHSVLSARGR